MHKTIIFALLLTFINQPSSAQDISGDTEWQNIDTSMAGLVKEGYAISAMTTLNIASGLKSGTRILYLLSKGNHVVRCGDAADFKPSETRLAVLKCQELTQPHPADKTSN